MPSIRSLVQGFQRGFDPKVHSTRLYDAFIEVENRLQTLLGSGATQKHYARVYNSAVVGVATATPTVIPFDSTRSQFGGMHSTSTLTSRLTVFRAGLYTITGHVLWPATVNGVRRLQIQLNGSTILASLEDDSPAAAPNDIDQTVATGMYLSVGDYIEIVAYQNSGGPINISVQPQYSPEAFIGEH